jgi:pyruvate dehydrogenase (quinone)
MSDRPLADAAPLAYLLAPNRFSFPRCQHKDSMLNNTRIRSIRLEDAADAGLGLRDAFAHYGPVQVDAVVNRQELAIPPKVSAEMTRGFTLYMVKAVMNGRTDEVIELARTNLWH